MKSNKSKIQVLVSCIFAFLLTLAFTALFICIGLGFGGFNSRTLLSQINESNYYNKVYDNLNNNAAALVTEAGFPDTVLTDVITLERVYIAGQNYIDATLDGTEYKITTEKIRDRLTDNIYQYLLDEGIVLTEELDAGIGNLATRLENDYRDGLQLQFVISFTEYRSKFLSMMKYMMPILIVIIGILCYFLIRIHRYAHRGVRYIVYALMSSSLLLILLAGYLLAGNQYTRMNASPDYYKDFLTAYLRWDITVFLYIGGMGVTVAIALISLISFLKNRIMDN
jgi:hypothetical protein